MLGRDAVGDRISREDFLKIEHLSCDWNEASGGVEVGGKDEGASVTGRRIQE